MIEKAQKRSFILAMGLKPIKEIVKSRGEKEEANWLYSQRNSLSVRKTASMKQLMKPTATAITYRLK
ncbi:hypothetical protein [Acinetobacter seifertii]|uniref:hypothetical protein n=1 Tax=Acinetobacter seifertii TaxID=1530123 RepID=UPI003F6F5D67